jgi:cytochrome P450
MKLTGFGEQLVAAVGSGALCRDPYPFYASIRDADEAVELFEGSDWGIARYETIRQLLRDPRVSTRTQRRRNQAGSQEVRNYRDFILIFSDPPRHTTIRKAFAAHFRPSVVARQRSAISEVVDEHLGRLSLRTNEWVAVDMVAEFSHLVPTFVVARIIGMPEEDIDLLHEDIVRAARLVEPPYVLSKEDALAINESADKAVRYFEKLLTFRKADPRPDLVSELALMPAFDEPDMKNIVAVNLLFLFLAGFETTSSAIAGSVLALLEHPLQLEVLKSDPDRWLPHGVEELLRYTSPLQMTTRIPREPFDLNDRTYHVNDRCTLFLGGANRDAGIYERPDELDVTREDNRHVAFGGGIHFCLGSHLARLELDLVLRAIVTRTELRLCGEPRWSSDMAVRHLESLPVEMRLLSSPKQDIVDGSLR